MLDKKKFQKEAEQVYKDTKCPVIYVNEYGDFFTQLDRAMLSVKQDKEKLATFDFTKNETKEPAKYTLTAADMEAYPELAKANLKEGDEIGFEPSKVSKKQLEQLLGK